ncbi:hypothetical protein NUACC26_006560 [Scytonema sp. NUACC26]
MKTEGRFGVESVMESWYYYTLFSPLWIEIARNAIGGVCSQRLLSICNTGVLA